jgi:hypothetical protein
VPLFAIHGDDETLQRRLISGPFGGAPRDEIQLGHPVRFGRPARQVPRRVGRGHHRRRGELADGDVIGVTISAFRPERHHDLRPHPAEVTGNSGDGLGCVDAVERAVGVVEEADLAQAELLGRGPKLRLPRAPNHVRRRTRDRVPESAALAARRGHQVRRNPFGGRQGQGAAGAERFVVGMRQHAHQSEVRMGGASDASQ